MMAVLRHPRVWLTLGAVWVGMVIYACLIPQEPSTGIPGMDKLLHFCAFAGLAGWFGAVVRRSRHGLVGIGLLLLGMAIEILQGQTGRDPSIWDWAADAVGVGFGLVMAPAWGVPVLRYVETRVTATRNRYF